MSGKNHNIEPLKSKSDNSDGQSIIINGTWISRHQRNVPTELLAVLYVRGGKTKSTADLAFAFNNSENYIWVNIARARRLLVKNGLSRKDLVTNISIAGYSLSERALKNIEFPKIRKR